MVFLGSSSKYSSKNFPLKHIGVHWWYISLGIIWTQQKSLDGIYHLCYSVIWKKNVWSAMDTTRNFQKPGINRPLIYIDHEIGRGENRSNDMKWLSRMDNSWKPRTRCLISWPCGQHFFSPVQPPSFLGLKTDKHLIVMLISFQQHSVIFICLFIEIDFLCFIECD